MLQHQDRDFFRSSREEERGGEAPMEIDSPPPLWLLNNNNNATSPKEVVKDDSVLSTPSQNHNNIKLAGELPRESPTPAKIKPTTPSGLSVKSSSPLASGSVPRRMYEVQSHSSPLRSVHHNGHDAFLNLRRLNYGSHSPTNSGHHLHSSPASSYVSMGVGGSPLFALVPPARRTPPRQASASCSVKKSRTVKDPTKAAAAAALVTSSSTSWHLHFPIILMNYFQLIFNTSIGLGLLYLIILGTRTVLHDAQLKVDERLQVMMAEISHCSRQYVDNRCSPEMRVPAMEKACMEWETCMSRDPAATSRSRLFAETIAEILNGFFGAISTKTYICLISGAVMVVVFFNAAFYFGRQFQPAIRHASGTDGGFYRPGPSHLVDSLLSSHFSTPVATPVGHSSANRLAADNK